MWYKKHEIKNTGRGYVISYGHYEDENNIQSDEPQLRLITSYTRLYIIDGFYEHEVKDLSLKYIIPREEGYRQSGMIHFQSVEDCKKFIDFRDEIMNRNHESQYVEDYNTVYKFE